MKIEHKKEEEEAFPNKLFALIHQTIDHEILLKIFFVPFNICIRACVEVIDVKEQSLQRATLDQFG